MEHSSPTQRSYTGGNGQAEYGNSQAEYGNGGGYAAYGGQQGYPEYGSEQGYPGYEGERGHVGYGAERGHTEYGDYAYGGDQGYGGYSQDYRPHQYADPSSPPYNAYMSQGYEDSQVAGNSAGSAEGMSNFGNRSSVFRTKESYAALNDSDSERRKNRGCLDRICCCRAKWAQWCGLMCCLIFLAIIAFGVVLAVTFKKPSVEFMGVGNYPDPNVEPYVAKNGAFDINVGLNIKIENPNIIGASFPRIRATARYPDPNQTQIGGGELKNVDISSHSVTNITFPFSINYDTSEDPNLVVVRDLLGKCKNRQQIRVNYTLVVTVKVIVVNINLSFDRSADIDCPIDDNNMPVIPGLDTSNLKRGL